MEGSMSSGDKRKRGVEDDEVIWIDEYVPPKHSKRNKKRRHTTIDLSTSPSPTSSSAIDAKYECGCCFEDTSINDLLQCNQGHIFCKHCVARLIEVKIGEGASLIRIPCMKSDDPVCTADIPPSELRIGLSPELFEKYQLRLDRESIEKVLLDDSSALEQCPFCDYVAEMLFSKEENRIFICENPSCKKESCRLCREPAHIPLRCDEVEKESDKNVRVQSEEKVTAAVIRECPVCKGKGVTSRFVKESGCNKMTCPKCASLICYQCEKKIDPKIGYGHFCQHFRDPKVSVECQQCTKCRLWTSEEYDNDMERKKKAAEQASKKKVRNPVTHAHPAPPVPLPAAVQPMLPQNFIGQMPAIHFGNGLFVGNFVQPIANPAMFHQRLGAHMQAVLNPVMNPPPPNAAIPRQRRNPPRRARHN
jgi:TRIAD3 protein (E3 ubiquitin-protein ligase RNF216)